MRLYAELLLAEDSGPLSPAQAEDVGVILEGTQNLERSARDFLYIEEARHGALRLHHASIEIGEIMRGVQHAVGDSFRRRAIDLEIPTGFGLSRVETDPKYMTEALAGLLMCGLNRAPSGVRAVIGVHDLGGGSRVEVTLSWIRDSEDDADAPGSGSAVTPVPQKYEEESLTLAASACVLRELGCTLHRGESVGEYRLEIPRAEGVPEGVLGPGRCECSGVPPARSSGQEEERQRARGHHDSGGIE